MKTNFQNTQTMESPNFALIFLNILKNKKNNWALTRF